MIKPVNGGINLPYGAKPYSFAPTNPDGTSFGYAHHGVDLQASTGTSVKAPEGGKVLFSGLAGTAGNMVQIQSPTGVHRLLHNSQVLVKVGQAVSEGQEVAKSGYSGLVDPPGPAGAHVHWDLAVNGKYVDPMLYIKGGSMATDAQIDETINRLHVLAFNRGASDATFKDQRPLFKNNYTEATLTVTKNYIDLIQSTKPKQVSDVHRFMTDTEISQKDLDFYISQPQTTFDMIYSLGPDTQKKVKAYNSGQTGGEYEPAPELYIKK